MSKNQLNYVITGFDSSYWNWGMSWLTSLSSKHDPSHTIVIDCNLNYNIKKKISDMGVKLIPCEYQYNDIKSSILFTIINFSKKTSGIFAHWDADVFFQDDISDIFELSKNGLIVSRNNNSGFISGPSSEWSELLDIQNIINFAGDKNNFCDCLIEHFGQLISKVDNTWNFIELPELKNIDGKLYFENKLQKVIHPSGVIKDYLLGSNIDCWEKVCCK